MTEGLSDNLRRAAGYGDPPSESQLAHAKQLEEERAARGKPLGLSAAQVEMADRLGMPLGEYRAMLGARTAADYDRIRHELAAERRAQEQAEHERAVEAAKRAVSS